MTCCVHMTFFANDFVPYRPFLRVPRQRITSHHRVRVEYKLFTYSYVRRHFIVFLLSYVRVFSRGIFCGGFPLYGVLCTNDMCPGFFANDFVPYHPFLRVPKQRVTIHQRVHVEHRVYSPTAMYEGISSCFCCRT